MPKRDEPKPPETGRPSDYRPEYCDILRAVRKQGKPPEAFRSLVSISKATYYRWLKEYPDFAEAADVAEADSHTYLHDIYMKGAMGEIDKFNASAMKDIMSRQHGAAPSSEATNKTEINIGSMNILQQMSDTDLLQKLTILQQKNPVGLTYDGTDTEDSAD